MSKTKRSTVLQTLYRGDEPKFPFVERLFATIYGFGRNNLERGNKNKFASAGRRLVNLLYEK
jgi:hypothetical protein